MFGFRPNLPVTEEKQEWLDNSFQHLIGLFGADWVRNAPLVLPNPDFFPREWEPTEEWARYAFDRVCELMRVERGRIDLEFHEDGIGKLLRKGVPLGRFSGAAGYYHKIQADEGPSRALITIQDSSIRDPEVMVATMAHELAHVLLLGDERIARDMEGMEPLTDLMTVFSGFGILNANAAFVHRGGRMGLAHSALGYLSQREYGYSLALFAWARGEANPRWTRELTKNVRVFMQDTLACFRASNRPLPV